MGKEYKYHCDQCNSDQYLDYKTAWFNCKDCGEAQSTGILCGDCGSYFKPHNNTWAYMCTNCKSIVNSSGRVLPASSVVTCKNCSEVFLKQTHFAKHGNSTGIYQCPCCTEFVDTQGELLQPEELCMCQECQTPFIREQCQTKQFIDAFNNTFYQCPCCKDYLEYTGHSTSNRKMDRCNCCNIQFTREFNQGHPWIIACPNCRQYVDNYGDPIGKQFIETCTDCQTIYTTWDHEPLCPTCGKSNKVELSVPIVLECQNCGLGLTQEDVATKMCKECGYILEAK